MKGYIKLFEIDERSSLTKIEGEIGWLKILEVERYSEEKNAVVTGATQGIGKAFNVYFNPFTVCLFRNVINIKTR